MRHARTTAYIKLLIVTAIWGMAGPVIKHTLDWFPPILFLLYRYAISALIGAGYFAFRKNSNGLHSDTVMKIMGVSFFTVTLTLLLIFEGFARTTSFSGSVLMTSAPILGAFMGVAFLHDRITNREKRGMALALLGTMITVLSPLLAGKEAASAGTILGNFLIILAMVTEGIGFILTKLLMRKNVDPIKVTHLSFIIAFIIQIPLTLTFMSPDQAIAIITSAPLEAHLGVLYMAVLSGTLGYILHTSALKTIEVSEASVFKYLSPLFAAPLAFLWLKESIEPLFLVGLMLIAFGVYVAESKIRGGKGLSKRK